MGLKITKIGKLKQADMIMMNPQSSDIAIVRAYTKRYCWIAKKEIGEIPIIGLVLKATKNDTA